MPTRVFSEVELARLRGFSEITTEELFRFFTLTAADETFLRSMRQPATVLGVVQLCTLPWLGFVPDEVSAAPPVAVERLAARLGVAAGELAGYGRRGQTRTEHLRTVMTYLKWRSAEELSLKELDEFLLARAMEHDSPTLLFRLACEHLRTSQVVRPGPVALLERVASARARAERETYDRIVHLLTPARRLELDGLLTVDPELGVTRLRWLCTGATEASPATVKAEVKKLTFLRGLDAHTLDLSSLPGERRRFLATIGARASVPALVRRDPARRYPIVLTLLAQSATDVLDEVVAMFDQAVSARESRARHRLQGQLAERATLMEESCAWPSRSCRYWATRGSRTRRPAGCCANGSGWPASGPRWRPRPRSRCRLITVTSPRSSPPTRTCASSPRRSWPRSSLPAARARPPCSRPSPCCAG